MNRAPDNRSRGRPTLGRQRMVTVGLRIEPDERAQLEELANEAGLSLCAYLRELIRRELRRAEGRPPLRACN